MGYATFIISLFLILPGLASPAFGQHVMDLSRAPGTVSQPAAPRQGATVTIVNLAPAASYQILVLRERIPVPPLDLKSLGSGGEAVRGECSGLTLAKTLASTKDERAVAVAIIEIEEIRKGCSDSEQRLIDFYLGGTRRVVDVGPIQAGEQATVTVTRTTEPTKSWILVLTGGARGTWRTLYGAALGPGREEKFFARATGSGEFMVTKEREEANEAENLAVIPAAFFQWLPMTRELNDWAFGPTLGLGVKSDRPAFFAGGIVTFNQNLGFVVGVPFYQELALRGNFSEGQTISENLTEDQLHKKVYRFQKVFFAGVFRFSGNPFGRSAQSSKTETARPAGERGAPSARPVATSPFSRPGWNTRFPTRCCSRR